MEDKIDEYLKDADNLIDKCDSEFSNIRGSFKLRKKLEKEKIFLLSLKKRDAKSQETSLRCLNLFHFKAIIKHMQSLENVVEMFKSVKNELKNILVIDIICENGSKWIKVYTRKAETLHFKFFCEYDMELKNQVDQFLKHASLNCVNFKAPSVLFHFANGITKELHEYLSKFIRITGPIVELDKKDSEKFKIFKDLDSSEDEAENSNDANKEISDDENLENSLQNETQSDENAKVNKVNLDVTTLLSMVSDITNGFNDAQFDKDYLIQQSISEKETPLLQVLEEFFKGKELFVCENAAQDFRNIVFTVGGPNERERYQTLMNKVKIVADNPSEYVMALKENKKISRRSKIIFGTGESLKAITTTSNLHLVRAAQAQGVTLSIFPHQPRALTEQKANQLNKQYKDNLNLETS